MHILFYFFWLRFIFQTNSVRVSNELGLGHPRATKYSVYIAVLQCFLIGILCMVIVLLARNHLAIIFSSSKDMQEAVGGLAFLLGITMVLNSVQPVISGTPPVPLYVNLLLLLFWELHKIFFHHVFFKYSLNIFKW